MATALLTALHIATTDFVFIDILQLDEGLDPDRLRSLFRLPREQSLPTWFSVILLLGCGMTLILIAAHEFRRNGPLRYAWLSLGVIFVAMSIDEQIQLHETVGRYLQDGLETDGFLLYAWVIPGSVFAASAAALYWRWFSRLPRLYFLMFFGAGAIFLSGALFAEMFEAFVVSREGDSRFVLAASNLLQDPLEMAGASIFLYALLHYGVWQLGWRRLSLGS